MQINKNVSKETLTAMVAFCKTIAPEVTEENFIQALINFSPAGSTKPKTPEVVSINEAKELLGVSRPTLNRYLKDGLLPKIKIGLKTVRIPRSAINELLSA